MASSRGFVPPASRQGRIFTGEAMAVCSPEPGWLVRVVGGPRSSLVSKCTGCFQISATEASVLLTYGRRSDHGLFAQFLAVCRRSRMVAMGTRRPRRGARLCRRCALPRRRETPRPRQMWKRNKKGAVKPWLRRLMGAHRAMALVASFAHPSHLLEAGESTEERISPPLGAHAHARPHPHHSVPRLALPAPLDGHAWSTVPPLLSNTVPLW